MKNPFEDTLIPEEEALTSLAYWFPILKEIGMRVPETIIVHRGDVDLKMLADGIRPPNYERFYKRLLQAMHEVGFPCFLRTGQTSHKHEWKTTCYVASQSVVTRNVCHLVESSFMANIVGRPFSFDFWAVRKIIPTNVVFTFFNGEMPIARELRFFINGGKVLCSHPYWPTDAFEGASDDILARISELQMMPPEDDEVYQMAKYIAGFFSGYWSVDFLQDKTGQWWCIDMATGNRSWHWPQCTQASERSAE